YQRRTSERARAIEYWPGTTPPTRVGPPTCEFTRYVRPRVATSSGSSPPTISPTSWNDSTDTKKSRPQTAPNRRQPDPRRTYKPDHLEVTGSLPHGHVAAVHAQAKALGLPGLLGRPGGTGTSHWP